MVWYKLKVGLWDIKYSPIKAVEQEFPNVDKDGNELTRVSGKFTKGYFTDKDGNRHEQAFKLIKGQPRGKFSRTKEVSNYKEVDLNEVEDLIIEKKYLVSGDLLLRELKESGKALKFGISFGGYKVYFAYLKPSIYEGFLEMSVGISKKSDVVLKVVDGLKEQKKTKEITLQVEQVEKAKVEDLIEI